MTARYLLIIPLIISLTVTCKNSKNSTKAGDTPVLKSETLTNDSAARFIVSFYSIGSGVEGDQIEKLLNFIDEYGKSKNKDIGYDRTFSGREGEVDYCFKLKELNAGEQKDFIVKAKSTLKSGKWITYFENQRCRKQN